MPYSFEWTVLDKSSNNDYGHQENSDGQLVSGSYRVLLPDSRTQFVTYTVNENGYVAEVKYEGEAKYPETQAAYSAPVASSRVSYNQAEASNAAPVIEEVAPEQELVVAPVATETAAAYPVVAAPVEEAAVAAEQEEVAPVPVVAVVSYSTYSVAEEDADRVGQEPIDYPAEAEIATISSVDDVAEVTESSDVLVADEPLAIVEEIVTESVVEIVTAAPALEIPEPVALYVVPANSYY